MCELLLDVLVKVQEAGSKKDSLEMIPRIKPDGGVLLFL